MYGFSSLGSPFTARLEPDGRMVGVAGYDGSFGDEGRWWTRPDGTICRQWNNWLDGEARCHVAELRCDVIIWRDADGRVVDENYRRSGGQIGSCSSQ